MSNAKAELRAGLKRARLAMPDEAHRLASQAIVERLKQATDWSDVKSLHYFEPLGELLEPDTKGFVTYLEDTYPTLRLSTSRLINGNWELIGVHGGAPPAKFDVVIVPLLGFDPQTRHRIGYGGGYYDRFLATQPQAQKIGVCFEAGRVGRIPTEPHDIALDSIVTEDKTHA